MLLTDLQLDPSALSAQLSAARVLVVGDVMLDRYWFGDVNRISPEAPVPVARPTWRGTSPRWGGKPP